MDIGYRLTPSPQTGHALVVLTTGKYMGSSFLVKADSLTVNEEGAMDLEVAHAEGECPPEEEIQEIFTYIMQDLLDEARAAALDEKE